MGTANAVKLKHWTSGKEMLEIALGKPLPELWIGLKRKSLLNGSEKSIAVLPLLLVSIYM